MATKSVIQIDVQDQSFQKFLTLFDTYTKSVDELPDAWKQIDGAMGDAGKSFEKAAAGTHDALALAATSTALIVEALSKATKAQQGFGVATATSAKSMTSLAKASAEVGASIFGIGKFLAKVGSLGGLGAALAGIGSGFGIADLASSATNQSRNSRGLGLTPGQLNAFNINLSPYVNTSSILAGAANAQVDLTKQGALAALGISPQQAQSENAGQIAIQELKAVRRAWQQNHNVNSAQAQAFLQLGGSVADIRNVGTSNGRELGAAESSAISDASSLGFTNKVASDWRALDVQLRKSGVTIESSLIEGLAPLAQPLAHLSKEISDFLASFLKNDAPGIISEVSKGLSWLGNFLQSKDFKDDMTSLGKGITTIAHDIVAALKFFNLIPGADKPGAAGSSSAAAGAYPVSAGHVPYDPNDPRSNWPPAMRKAFGLPPVEFPYPDDADAQVKAKTSWSLKSWTDPMSKWDFSKVEAKNNLPPGYLKSLMWDESHGNVNAVSPKGARGPFQFMPDTARQYGIDPTDVGQAAFAAGLMNGTALKKYGDIRKTIASFNWGGGNLDKDIAAHGKDWEKFVPKETEGEINNVMNGMSRFAPKGSGPMGEGWHQHGNHGASNKPTHIVITNHTSARVMVSANAAYA